MVSKKIVLVELHQGIDVRNSTWVKGEGNLWRLTYSYESKPVDFSYGFGSWGLQPYGQKGDCFLEQNREPILKISSLSCDGDFYINASAYDILYNNKNTYSWENQILTIHTPGGITPNSFSSVVVSCSKGFSNYPDYYDNIYYDGRLGKISPMTRSIDNLYNGIVSYESGTIDLINSDGYFDNIRDFNIYGQKVKIFFGEDDSSLIFPEKDPDESKDNISFKQKYEGVIESFQTLPDLIQLKLIDPRKALSKEIPENKFTKEKFKNIEDDEMFIPLSYGRINKAVPVCINEIEGQPLYYFKVCDTTFHKIGSIDSVYVDGKEIDIYSIDLDQGIFALESKMYEPGGEIACNFNGYVDENGELIDNPVGVIEDILLNHTPFFYDESIFNIDEWEKTKNSTLPPISLYLDEPKKIMDIIGTLGKSFFGTFIIQGDGKKTIKKRDVLKKPVKTIYISEHVDNFDLQENSDEYISLPVIGYNKNIEEDKFNYYTNDGKEKFLFSKYQKCNKKKFETNLVNKEDVINYSIEILSIYGGYSRTFAFTTKSQNFDIELEDLIDVEIYGSSDGEEEIYGQIRMEVLSIQHDYNNFTAKISGRWIKDVSDNINIFKLVRFNKSKNYSKGSVASSGGKMWRCSIPAKGFTPELSPDYWERFVSINWNEFTIYKKGETVSRNGIFYKSKTINNAKPPEDNGNDWEKTIPTWEEIENGYTAGNMIEIPENVSLSVEPIFKGFVLRWDRQANLSNLKEYQLQVSGDKIEWFELCLEDSDFKKGIVNNYTHWVGELLVHSNIPFSGTEENPGGKTLFYRIRRVTKKNAKSDWTDVISNGSGTTKIVKSSDIAANSITANKLEIDVLNAMFANIKKEMVIGKNYTTEEPPIDSRRLVLNNEKLIVQEWNGSYWITVVNLGGTDSKSLTTITDWSLVVGEGKPEDGATANRADSDTENQIYEVAGNVLEAAKREAADRQSEAEFYADSIMSAAERRMINDSEYYTEYLTELTAIEAKAYADGIVTDEEKRAIAEAQEVARVAKDQADATALAAEKDVLAKQVETKAYADGIVTSEESRAIAEAQEVARVAKEQADAAALTADWGKVSGNGKPEDGATVGATEDQIVELQHYANTSDYSRYNGLCSLRPQTIHRVPIKRDVASTDNTTWNIKLFEIDVMGSYNTFNINGRFYHGSSNRYQHNADVSISLTNGNIPSYDFNYRINGSDVKSLPGKLFVSVVPVDGGTRLTVYILLTGWQGVFWDASVYLDDNSAITKIWQGGLQDDLVVLSELPRRTALVNNNVEEGATVNRPDSETDSKIDSALEKSTKYNEALNGISKGGILTGDILVNSQYENLENPGELYYKGGSFIHPNGNRYENLPANPIYSFLEGGHGYKAYLMFVGSDLARFNEWLKKDEISSFLIVQYHVDDDKWIADLNTGFDPATISSEVFTPNENDCIIAAVEEAGIGEGIKSVQYFAQVNGADLSAIESKVTSDFVSDLYSWINPPADGATANRPDTETDSVISNSIAYNSMHYKGTWRIGEKGEGFNFKFPPIPIEYKPYMRLLLRQLDLEAHVLILMNEAEIIPGINGTNDLIEWKGWDMPDTSLFCDKNNVLRIGHDDSEVDDWGVIYDVQLVFDQKKAALDGVAWASLSGRPTMLSELDSDAGSKLEGIEPGATVGATPEQITAIEQAQKTLSSFADDSILTPLEKLTAVRAKDAVIQESTGFEQSAALFSIDISSYKTVKENLIDYINPFLTEISVESVIERAIWDKNWSDYFKACSDLKIIIDGKINETRTTLDSIVSITDTGIEILANKIGKGLSGTSITSGKIETAGFDPVESNGFSIDVDSGNAIFNHLDVKSGNFAGNLSGANLSGASIDGVVGDFTGNFSTPSFEAFGGQTSNQSKTFPESSTQGANIADWLQGLGYSASSYYGLSSGSTYGSKAVLKFMYTIEDRYPEKRIKFYFYDTSDKLASYSTKNYSIYYIYNYKYNSSWCNGYSATFVFKTGGNVARFKGIPSSPTGLITGQVYHSNGVLKIVT